MQDETITITFVTDGDNGEISEEVVVSKGKTVLEIVQGYAKKVELEGACGGACACATCHVILRSSPSTDLDDPSDQELDMLELAEDVQEDSRLGCQVVVTQDCTIYIPPSTRSALFK